MGKFQVLDEHGDAVEWKAPRDTCQDLGLECYQVNHERATVISCGESRTFPPAGTTSINSPATYREKVTFDSYHMAS